MTFPSNPYDQARALEAAEDRARELELLLEESRARVRADVAEAVKIIPEAIGEEYARLPADLALANSRYAAIYERHLKAEADMKYTRAIVRIEHRNRMKAVDAKATETAIDAEVEQDARYRQSVAAHIAADVARVQALGDLDALRAKRDMLISIGAHIRSELRSLYGMATDRPGAGHNGS